MNIEKFLETKTILEKFGINTNDNYYTVLKQISNIWETLLENDKQVFYDIFVGDKPIDLKVGDKFYQIVYVDEIEDFKIENIEEESDRICYEYDYHGDICFFDKSDIGVYVFLTIEDAKNELKRLGYK